MHSMIKRRKNLSQYTRGEWSFKIKVKDNGVGIDEDNKRADSIGHRPIGMLLDQLEGSIKTSNINGEIDIIINKYQKAL